MNRTSNEECVRTSVDAIVASIRQLAQEASVEISVHDVGALEASRRFLPRGKQIYISHLPGQTWEITAGACRMVHDAGFVPIPHVPVRLIDTASALESVLAAFVQQAHVREILLIAGDYAEARGPYATVSQVLRSGIIGRHGLARISFAGHPEGHPKVASTELRRALLEKVQLATAANLEVTLVTQFFFDHSPFLRWAEETRAAGVQARIVGGLAGPTNLARLFKFAMRCGVGPSIRALGARPTSFARLLGDHGPEGLLRGLGETLVTAPSWFNGVHFFCFGGYLRTCEWLDRVTHGHFEFDDRDAFAVHT